MLQRVIQEVMSEKLGMDIIMIVDKFMVVDRFRGATSMRPNHRDIHVGVAKLRPQSTHDDAIGT